MKECLRLRQDCEIKSIERKLIKTSTLEKDMKGQSDAEEQHEEYNTPLIGTEKVDASKRTTRSVTRLRSRNFPEPTTLSDVESDDSEVDMGKLKKGRRASSSPSDAA